jgi:hypothetical protein
MVLRDWSLQITHFQLSTVQWRRSVHHFRRRLAFTGEIFGLWAAARPWNPIPLNSWRTVMVLAGQFVALWNSRVIVSLDVWRISRTTFFNAGRSLSVIKRRLPSHGFVVVVPSRFHFTITSPTIDFGNLRRVAMSLTDFLLMWQPISSPRSKSLSYPNISILLALRSNEQHSFLPGFILVSAVILTSRLVYYFRGMSGYFWSDSVCVCVYIYIYSDEMPESRNRGVISQVTNCKSLHDNG